MRNAELFDKAKDAHEKNDFNKALELYLNCLNDDFNDPDILHYLGTLMFQMGYNGGAANILARAIQCKSTNIDSLTNLGAAYYKEWDLEGAREIWSMALDRLMEAEPRDSSAIVGVLNNLGGIGIHAGDYPDSVQYYRKALELEPNSIHALGNLSLANLAVGNWREGWIGYESHLIGHTRKPRTYKGMVPWNGEEGKSVIVYGEQGLGDEIMFASMIPDLVKRSKRVIFDCHPRLVETFRRSFGIECHGTRKTDQCEWFPGCGADSVIAIGSLGRFFRNERAEFPGTPYLKPRTQGKKFNKRPRIGLSWKGGVKSTGDRMRRVGFDDLAPLVTAFPDADWVSLQYHTDSPRAVLEAQEKFGIKLEHKPSIVEGFDYDATLDLIAGLDLVISVPTTVIHGAGALGVPCWVMVQKEAAWRETGNVPGRGEQMPWYNSVKLFHKQEDTWEPLINRVINELSDFLELRGTEQKAA